MPRPPDTYTHSQFTLIDSDDKGETVQCNHCKQWTGNVKTLNRKKDHLLKCSAYALWRAQGNGQDLAPPNRYNKRDSSVMNDEPYDSPYARYKQANAPPAQTPTMVRHRNYDMSKVGGSLILDLVGNCVDEIEAIENKLPDVDKLTQYTEQAFTEFWDGAEQQKVLEEFRYALKFRYDPLIYLNMKVMLDQCMRVRCNHCGYVRAKNTTRQAEHLASCKEFLESAEGQEAIAMGAIYPSASNESINSNMANISTITNSSTVTNASNGDIWRGGAPNPNLQAVVNHRGPNKARLGSGSKPTYQLQPAAAPKPSLATHLLHRVQDSLNNATQSTFLSHAGCGTLSSAALNQWLAQEIHISRAIVPFVGGLIYKTRVPEVLVLTQDSTFRALDLLCSAVSNMKKELEFLETTKRKYRLNVPIEEPKPATKGLIDLFASASSAQASLLEGLVVLWAVEHCFCKSFQYAATFTSTMPASSNYSLPSYLDATQGAGNTNSYGVSTNGSDKAHISALHEAFIQNWTSNNFSRFVDACKAIVDEVANAQTSGNGMTEMRACERVFKQVSWLWGQTWPEVDGMGQEEDLGPDEEGDSPNGAAVNNKHRAEKLIEIGDDEEDDADASMDSPYGGTGLGVVAAANRAA